VRPKVLVLDDTLSALDIHTEAEVEAALTDPAAFLSAEAPGHAALQDQARLKADLEILEGEWLELEEKRQG